MNTCFSFTTALVQGSNSSWWSIKIYNGPVVIARSSSKTLKEAIALAEEFISDGSAAEKVKQMAGQEYKSLTQ